VIEGPSGARKNMLAAAAAVVLVVGGAAGGYRFYARQSHATTPAPSQQNAITSPAPVSEPVVATDTAPVPDPEPAALAVAPPAPEPTTDIVSESRPVRPESRQLPARAPTPKVAAANTAAPRHVVPVEQLKAPTLKQAAARMEPGAPPPVVADSLNLGETAAGNTLLAAVAATAAAPPVSAGPAVGGHLQPPQVLNSTAPVYPMNARMQKIQGVVMLDALIDESGKVVSTTVISGPQPLVVAAQQAVQNWKYKPAQLNGKPVTVHAKVNVRFALQ
jgi:protein TonB